MKLYEYLCNRQLMILILAFLTFGSIFLYYNDVEVDITSDRANSIRIESKKYLKNVKLKDDIEIIYFSAITDNYSDTYVLDRMITIFNNFEKLNSKIHTKIVDLAKEPDVLRDYKYSDIRSVLVKYKGKEMNIPFEDFVNISDNYTEISIEEKLINTVKKIENIDSYKLYYTNTHGEKFNDSEYSDFNFLLSSYGYDMRPLDLSKDISEYTNVIYILAPERDFRESEIEKLKDYIDEGGKLFISLETNMFESDFENLKELCEYIGLVVGDEVIIDQIQGNKLIGLYTEHEINKNLRNYSEIIYMPMSRKLEFALNDDFIPRAVLISGELSESENGRVSSYPLVIEFKACKNDQSKILISATPELLSNNNISYNKYFISRCITYLDSYKYDYEVEPLKYVEYKVNTESIQTRILFVFIVILVPGYFLYLGYKKASEIYTSKSR